MGEYVKDAVLTGDFDSLPLIRLVELTIHSIQHDRPLFSNLLDEPAFYRKHFYIWVREALSEKQKLAQIEEAGLFSEE